MQLAAGDGPEHARGDLQQLIEVSQRVAALDDPAALLAGLFAFAPVGFQVYSADGQCVLTNAEFRRIFGSEPPPGYNVLRDEIAEQAGVLGLIHRAFAGEVVKVPTVWYDPRLLRQVHVEHANRVAIQATFFPLFDRDGRVAHVAIAFKDMTAEVTARERVDAERQRLATVLEQLPTGVVIAEAPSGELVQGNAQVERIWRHPFAKSYAEYRGFHPDGRLYRDEEWPLVRAIRSGEVIESEIVQIERGDGTRGTLRISAAPVRDAEGAISAGVVIFDDVTDQRRAEQSVARLLELTTELAAALTVDEVAAAVVEHGVRALEARMGMIALLTEDGSALEVRYSQGYPAEVEARLHRVSLSDHWPMTDAVRTAEPVFVDGMADAQERYPALVKIWQDETANHANASIPLVVTGRVIGVLGFSYASATALDQHARSFVLTLARQCAQAVHRAQLYASEQLARHTAEQASQELRASRDLLAGVLRGVSDAVTAQDASGRLLFANEAAAALMGFASPDAVIANSPEKLTAGWQVLDEDGQPFDLERLPGRRALRGESAPEALIRYRRRPDGEDRWSLVRAQTVHDALGRAVASISVTQDVTERKRAEERLRFLAEAGARIPASLEVADTLNAVASVAVETLADWCAVYLFDHDGNLTESLVRHRDPAREQQALAFQRQYPPQQRDSSLIGQVMHNGQPVLLTEVGDEMLRQAALDPEHLRLLRELGITSAIWVPLRARNRALGILGLFTAESRRRLGQNDRALAEEVAARASLAIDNAVLFASERIARAQAEEAVQARDEFLGIASHELRNPVAAISGTAQLMQRGLQRGALDDPRLREYVSRLHRTSTHLAMLTEDLLDVANLQRGELPLRLESTDFAALVRDCVERRIALGDDAHRLVLHLARSTWPVVVDRARMQQLVDNLLDNAVKYSPSGGAIDVALSASDGGVQLTVRDRGIGLPAGAERTIFEPLKRAPNASERNIPGLGLGLYISRRLAEQHGGRLWATSQGVNLGTTFWLWLPEPAESEDASPGA